MRTKGLVLSTIGLFVLALSVTAWAQMAAKLDVPFAFSAGGKDCAAGKYEIRIANDTSRTLTLRHLDSGDVINVPILTRLSAREEGGSLVYFDKGETKNYLSEVYFPGMDGFHFQGAPGKHTHTKIGLGK